MCGLVMIKWCFCLLYRQYMSIYHLFIQDTMEDAQNNFMRHLPIITIPPQKKHIWIKCPLLQKGANHLLLQKEVFP